MANKTTCGPSSAAKPVNHDIDDKDEFVQRFLTLYNSPTFSDVVLRVSDQRFHAHRFVLITASEVFEAMLDNKQWKEAHQPEVELTEDEPSSEVFPDFLKYLYCGHVEMTPQKAHPLLVLADKYLVKVLRKSCVDYMSTHMVQCPDTCWVLTWYSYAKLTTCSQLENKCFDFILSNFNLLAQAPDWVTLDRKYLLEFLSSDELVIESEFVLWKHVQRWINSYCEDKKLEENAATVKEIVSCVRFTMMTPAELYFVESGQCYKDHVGLMKERVMSAYRTHYLLQDQRVHMEKPERYRNYTSNVYRICADFSKIYTSTDKMGHRISLSVPSPYSFTPVSEAPARSCGMFEAALYPSGFSWLFGGATSKNLCVHVSFSNTILYISKPVKVGVTVLLYGRQNGVEYVAYSYSKEITMSKRIRTIPLDDIIAFDKLTAKNSVYRVNDSVQGKLFLKVQEVLKEEETSLLT